MQTGYVLNFSNPSFSEFVRESTGRDIFSPRYDHASNSKANRMRAFWQKEDNAVVGKLLKDLLEYSEETGVQAEACQLIVARLLQGSRDVRPPVSSRDDERGKHHHARSQALLVMKDEFLQLAQDSDRARAGLALERLLNRLFEIYELQPRQPFRIVGEQIDGSFQLDGQVYLLESKWEKQPLPESDLLVFRGKIEGKSTFTRGVLIALNSISIQARDAITRGKAPNFFVVDGFDLTMILSEVITLTEFLRRRVRLLAEEGIMCVDFSRVMQQ